MNRRRVVSGVAGAAGGAAVFGAVLHALVVHGTIYLVEAKSAEARERDPAGAVWYAGQLASGSHLALPAVPYRGALLAYLSSLSPGGRTAWWDEALALADDTAAFVAEQKRLSAAQAAAKNRGPDPFRSTAAPGPTLLKMSIVWEAAANMADKAGQRDRAVARWQAMADARHADAMRWWNEGSVSTRGLSRQGPPPPRPVMPRWVISSD